MTITRRIQKISRLSFINYDLMVSYDSFNFQHLISPRVLLIIAGTKAQKLHYSETALEVAKGLKEFFAVEGKNNSDLYDDLEKTGPKLIEFFKGIWLKRT